MARRRSNGLSRRRAAQRAGYRSAFEQEAARQATEVGIEFEYEPIVIEYQREPGHYKPDFILANGVIVETKGRFTSEDRKRHLLIKKQKPEYDIRFVFQYDNRLDRRSSTTYSQWCDQHGFKWAIRYIPLEWAQENNNKHDEQSRDSLSV